MASEIVTAPVSKESTSNPPVLLSISSELTFSNNVVVVINVPTEAPIELSETI